MSSWKVPLADVVVSEEDIEAVVATYRSGWLTMGPQTERFEHAFGAYTGSRYALAVANGTGALHLACLATGLGPGDEVIVPSMTFVASVNAIAYAQARPVFADIAGPTRPWLSVAAAEKAITARTRAVMSVAYGGHPGEIELLQQLCRDRGLVLIEDAAHATGSRLRDRHLGTFGDVGTFSFFSNKNLAIGEGGAIVTDDENIALRLRLLRSHGMTTLTWDRHRGHAASYDVVDLGFNYRIDEPRAALAARRLASLDDDNAKRAGLDSTYREAFADIDRITIALPPDGNAISSHHLFVIVLEDAIDRDRFRSLMAEHGVQTSVHYPPAHQFSIYASGAPALPITEAFGARAVTLPLFAHMQPADQEIVVAAVHAALHDAATR